MLSVIFRRERGQYTGQCVWSGGIDARVRETFAVSDCTVRLHVEDVQRRRVVRRSWQKYEGSSFVAGPDDVLATIGAIDPHEPALFGGVLLVDIGGDDPRRARSARAELGRGFGHGLTGH
jgi:hypothetical protein